MKIFITGEIVSTKTEGCFSPIDLRQILESVDKNEPLEVEITSEGGNVFAGVQIANMLARHQGKVTTHAVGLCASIATIILMAGDEVVVDDNCFCMIHRPWSCIEGNAADMAKEIDALDKCEKAMIGYYMKRSKVDSSVLSQYLADESWFLGEEFAKVFECNVVPSDKVFNIAASLKSCKYKLKNIPKGFKMPEEKEETAVIVEDPAEKIEQTVEEIEETAEKIEESATEQTEGPAPTVEELMKKVKELEERLAMYEKDGEEAVTKEECERRVSGMQAKMQLQINDFANQLKVRDGELAKAKADVISLEAELEKTTGELSKTASALVEKENALAKLNAGVNSPCETTDWRGLKGKEFWDFLKKHPEITK